MIEPRCKHNWVTPPECPQCCSDERDQLRQQLEAAQKALKEEKQWSEDLAGQCCEMEDALGFKQDQHGPKGEFVPTIRPWKERVRDLIAKEAELAEKQGWVSPEKVKALVKSGNDLAEYVAGTLEGAIVPCHKDRADILTRWFSAKKDL